MADTDAHIRNVSDINLGTKTPRLIPDTIPHLEDTCVTDRLPVLLG